MLEKVLFFCLTFILLYYVHSNNCWYNGTVKECVFEDEAVTMSLVKKGRLLHFLMDPDRKLVGCWTAKVGSRELVASFENITNCRQDHYLADCKIGTKCDLNKQRNKCHNITINQAFSDPEFKRFVVMRDPLVRLVSCFLDKYSYRTAQFPGRYSNIGNFKFVNYFDGNLTTWKDYLAYTNQKPSLRLLLSALPYKSNGDLDTQDFHLHPQTAQCRVDNVRYDYVIDLEHITQGFKAMSVLEKRDFPLLGFNIPSLQRHRQHAKNRICENVDSFVEAKARQIFRRDYEALSRFGMTDLVVNVSRLCAGHTRRIQ